MDSIDFDHCFVFFPKTLQSSSSATQSLTSQPEAIFPHAKHSATMKVIGILNMMLFLCLAMAFGTMAAPVTQGYASGEYACIYRNNFYGIVSLTWSTTHIILTNADSGRV